MAKNQELYLPVCKFCGKDLPAGGPRAFGICPWCIADSNVKPKRIPRPRYGRRPSSDSEHNLPGGDEDVAADGPSVITAIRSAKKEAEDSRRTRLALNRQNMQAYMGMQDFSYKDEGMSSEFLPKVGVATEQFAAFVKRALTQFGAWFDVELGRSSQSPLSEGCPHRGHQGRCVGEPSHLQSPRHEGSRTSFQYTARLSLHQRRWDYRAE